MSTLTETTLRPTDDRSSATGPPAAATVDAVLAAADRLALEAAQRADEVDAARTVPRDLVDRIRAAGLFRLALPRSLGGLEVEPPTMLQVIETLSHGDGSVGWTTSIGNGTAFFAYLDPAVARELIGDGDVTVAGSFAPTGLAVPTGAGEVTVDGRWPFNSGVEHAEWHMQGVLMGDPARPGPRLDPDGNPDWRFAFFPHAQPVGASVEIIDNWHVLGLRGTGSHDVEAHGVRLREEHTITPFTRQAPHDGPLWRHAFFGIVSYLMVGVPLGIGRRALDEIVTILPEKRRGLSARPLAEDPAVQRELGRAEVRLLAARSFVHDAMGAAWDAALTGDPVPLEHDRRLQVAMTESVEAAVAAVDVAFRLGGAAAVFDGNVLQRCFRDIHTAAQHIAFAPTAYDGWAQGRLGGGEVGR